ncbi:MAG: YciI family protein [Thermoleophilia bacterium]
MFLLLARYTKPAEEVDKNLEAHKAWIGEQTAAGRFVATAREVPLIGGLIIATNTTADELRDIIARDPFVTSGCAEYDIREYAPVRTAEGLEKLLEL